MEPFLTLPARVVQIGSALRLAVRSRDNARSAAKSCPDFVTSKARDTQDGGTARHRRQFAIDWCAATAPQGERSTEHLGLTMPITPTRIEVVAEEGDANKQKGDLLEDLTGRLLRSQSYEVETQIRVTGVELDLVALHKVSGRRIYVECKAHRKSLEADALTKLLGTLEVHEEYEEGWLVSAGPLGKDAKGISAEWQKKPAEKRSRLSIFTPKKLVDVLVDAQVVVSPDKLVIPDWCSTCQRGQEAVLLIAKIGYFWVLPVLASGVPNDVLVYEGNTGCLCTDIDLLHRLAATDSSLKSLNFELGAERLEQPKGSSSKETHQHNGQIIEVKQGESWDDYRPARPCDFVGRESAQRRLLEFLDNVREETTRTRVFAVTGDTGMGKSSLIVKLRDRIGNIRHRSRFFLFAVDVRAARGPQYILLALLECLRRARDHGYGSWDGELTVTDLNDPLESPAIEGYLATLRDTGVVICLVLDQFEELYSKPDLFPVFEQAERLFLSTASRASNLVVGFVLRSDSTVQQDHPAYHMWHRLSDHRFETRLRVFSPAETARAITLFEKELGEQLRPELRRLIAENCEGYPWLLKKLCIHLHEQIKAGTDQSDLNETMDVGALFARDLNSCSKREALCLDHIARQAPADWFDVLDLFGTETIAALQDKRLILRSGDRLNLYWDVFREYVLTKKVPAIPFTYLPSSPSVGAFLAAAGRLSRETPRSSEAIAQETGLSVKTAGNVIHDLIMFGLAKGGPSAALLDADVDTGTEEAVLTRIRSVLKRHALTRELQRFDSGSRITLKDMITALREVNPTAKHSADTWEIYAKRLGPWLIAAGLLSPCLEGWIAGDQGSISIPSRRGSRFRLGCFQADAPPAKVVLALKWLLESQPCTPEQIKASGNRNAIRILDRFELTGRDETGQYIAVHDALTDEATSRLVYRAAHEDETVQEVLRYLEGKPSASGRDIGRYISSRFQQPWNSASERRNGNALRIWALWIAEGRGKEGVPTPPGPRTRKAKSGGKRDWLFPE